MEPEPEASVLAFGQSSAKKTPTRII